ncbi:hypothetical protein RS030_81354 [Cryptosporidium xiaoi]|uniref:Uncharacterized protein n=1 Tax=Cryptosporidium xiaoi TaxID=659607 RepID=A0AAV9XT42_9CRYT
MMSFSCIVEGEECVWEFSDDHNVFSGSNINKYHCSSYFVKSITQLERSLSVCSLLRIKVNEKGLLVIQMVIKNDNHAIKDIKADDREISGTKDEKAQHIINTEFIIQPVNN